MSTVNPDDSASQCGKSATTTSSSAKVKARKAALAAEAAALREIQALELEELKLRQRKREVELRTQLSIAAAEEEVLSQHGETIPKSRPSMADSTLPYPKDVDGEFRHLLDAISLPKPEIMKFSGDPIRYHEFMTCFDNMILKSSLDCGGKLMRLYHLCEGPARNVIQSCMVMEPSEGFVRARELLAERFGSGYKIGEAWLTRVSEGKRIHANDHHGLLKFADDLRTCMETLKALKLTQEIGIQRELVRIVDRLPFHLQNSWLKVVRVIRQQNRSPDICDLVRFVSEAAAEINDPVFGRRSVEAKSSAKSKLGSNPRSLMAKGSFSTGGQEEKEKNNMKDCVLCQQKHTLFSCESFKKMTPVERVELAKEKRLCFNCLKPGHMLAKCNLNRTCTVKGCGRKHTRFLHVGKDKPAEAQRKSGEAEQQSHAESSSATGAGGKRVALPIVAVRVTAGAGVYDTFALLDSGSTSSFCTEHLKDKLQICGKKQSLRVSTLEKANSAMECEVISLQLKGMTTGESVDLPRVYTKKEINISPDHLAKREDIFRYSHLSDLDIPHYSSGKIDLLIGQDSGQTLIPLEVRRGKPSELYAVRTILGWTLNGPLDTDGFQYHISSSFVSGHTSLEDQVKKFWSIESPDALISEVREMSVMDKRVLQLWDDNVKVTSGHYELPIPFKERPPPLENNRWMAQQRLMTLRKRLLKDQNLHERYREGMADLLSKGYAEAVDEQSSSGIQWYIPHHPVLNPKKPDKVRIVFDCAAKYKETSLNDVVLQGPDLTNSLQGVLLKFRKESVALIADVESMFHQVRVPTDDRDVLRFLWWPEGDLDQKPAVYRMCAHLFGGTWSPSCCSYALKRTAEDNQDEFSEQAIETVKGNFYVDDCLVSVADEREAVKLSDELRRLLAKGGFRLSKWVSSNPDVMESIPMKDRAKKLAGLDFSTDALPLERALGVCWDVEQDCFTYRVIPKDKPMTRRGVLSIVASMYDPHGYAGPFVMMAKILLQEMTAMKLEWDEPLPPSLCQRWQDWQDDLVNMEKFTVNRCLKPHNYGDVTEYQLHHFSDASEKGYGAVSYLRLTNADGQVHNSIVMAKSRLAPLKKMTIPRLELMAATLSVRQDTMIRRHLELPFKESVYWTDSTIVLQYVRNEEKRFKTFVANRISTIHEGSEPEQWRHVNSDSNPADDLSRGQAALGLSANKGWTEGPEFLRQAESYWPQDPTLKESVDENDMEIKRPPVSVQMSSFHSDHGTEGSDPERKAVIDEFINYHSSWYKLRRGMAWLLRVKDYLRSKVHNSPFDVMKPLESDDLRKAEQAILRYVQQQSFPEEFKVLQEGIRKERERKGQVTRVKKSSSLSKLDPKMFSDGLIHVGGRLHHASVEDKTKHPIILPKMHHVVRLVIRHLHQMSGHSGREYVLSLLRQQYWVISGRVAVRQVLRSCVVCKRTSATPSPQKMADLPSDRVQAEKPPFTYVGVDCFGPFMVKQGRSQLKRYGCIFTCLVIRAVHIEILHSLETDSFLNALQRFMARRGKPEVIRSDNGTNFVGAERELRDGIRSWNQQKIQDHLLQKGVDWKFNPPSASHMGGPWERQIRTVRKILSALLKQQALTDEGLCTLMCLVEAVINGRPLTVVSDDIKDPEPLTPNHLLLLRQNNFFPSDVFGKSDLYSRRRWRQIQYLAGVFWRRWTHEYLPALQQRQKWSTPTNNLAVGDIVLIMEDLPRNQWLMGRIVETYPGRDSLVRTAKVKTKSATLVRPVHKLCLIESAE